MIDAEETPERKVGDMERDVDQELDELEREGDEMEERLGAIDDPPHDDALPEGGDEA